MTYLSSTTRTALLDKLATYEELLEDAIDSYASALATSNKSYKFDSTEGMQSVTKKSLMEHQKAIEFLEAQIDHISRRLRGGLNVNLNVRRKQGGNSRGRRFGY